MLFKSGINQYKRQLSSNPLRTKMLTSACLFSVGDVVCQQMESSFSPRGERRSDRKSGSLPEEAQKSEWDVQRTVRQGSIGGLALSPALHFFLTRVMNKVELPGRCRGANIACRVAVHQMCMMPLIQFTLLFGSGALQPAKSLKDRVEAGKTRFSEKWRIGFSASLLYWPLVNSVMYSLVQPRFFNLYADVASLVFASVMSYLTYNECRLDLFSGARNCLSSAVEQLSNGSDKRQTDEQGVSSQLKQLVWEMHQLHKLHLDTLLHQGSRVEAQQLADAEDHDGRQQLPWLLSTQT